jgi:hypothetical protein
MDEDDFNLSLPFWHCKEYQKGDYYNEYKSVCKYLGEKTQAEKNIFLYSKNQFVVTFKSFINQIFAMAIKLLNVPGGCLNRVRKIVYERVSRVRREMNKVPVQEP